jgi:hypothetical protein
MIETLSGKTGKIPNPASIFGSRKFRKVQEAAERVDRTVEKSREVGRQHLAKRTELEQLERDYDLSLTAAALDQDGADPQKLALEIGEAQIQLEALERKNRAVRRAVDIATGELAELVQSNRDEILAEANARILKAADKVLATAHELGKAEVELSEFEHIKQWCMEPERSLGAGPAHTGRYTAIQNVIAMAQHARAKAEVRDLEVAQ